jgi:hypothetical protein
MAEINAIPIRTRKAKELLGLDLHGWEQIMIWSLGLTALAAIAVVVSTASVVFLQREENARTQNEFARYQIEAGVKIEEARKEGVEAGRAAGDALVRAAELEKEATQARLETERIKATVAWRSISPEQAASLQQVLSATPGSVNLRYTDGDPEALFLAIQISQVLAQARWQVAPGALKIGNSITFGFALPNAESADGLTLRQAFAAAKIPFSAQLPQSNMASGFNISTIPGAPMLMVGSKALPQFP